MTGKDDGAKSDDFASKKPSIKQAISHFCSYTTAHGLGRLAESSSVFRRVAWSLFCIGALTMFVIQMRNLLVIYWSRPVATVVNVHHESHVRFPAVTVCNLNMIRSDKLPEDFIDRLIDELTKEALQESLLGNVSSTPSALSGAPSSQPGTTANPATDDLTPTGGTSDSATPSGNPQDEATSSPYDDDHNYNYDYNYDYNYNYDYDYNNDYYFGGFGEESKEEEFKIEETIRAELALQNDSTIVGMGHQFEDLVFECTFRGYDCRNYSRFWRHLWDYRYGNCYTFNGGVTDAGEGQKVLQSHITGPTGGLKLNLFIEQSQYIPELSHTAGARVVIHDQGQIPFPNNEGYSVLPSRSTSFAIRRTVIERVDPFGNGSCVSEKDLNRNSFYSKKFNVSYSRQACMNSCQAEKQKSDCGCAEGQFPSDAEICNSRNSTTAKCLEKIQLKLLTGELNCDKDCPTPCSEIQFGTTLSMGHWPSDGYEAILESRVKKSSVLANEQQYGYFLSENFLQVKVFYEQLNYEKVTERISYEGVNLVADIGGQLGLWIGISVLTCCEFLELAWVIIHTVVGRVSQRNIIHLKPQP